MSDDLDRWERQAESARLRRIAARHGEECECSACNPPLVLCKTCGEDVDDCTCADQEEDVDQ